MHPEIWLSEVLAAACNSEAPAIAFHVSHFLREALTAAHNSEAPAIAFHVGHFLREAHCCPQLRVPILCLTILYKPSVHISYFFSDALTAACNSECKVFL
ncbi:hypothetical protein HHX47_DHR10000192 [Lentinula edodes]|nr:hypothetical protein HHX47_DHR10000192 [Lentinula edodes]